MGNDASSFGGGGSISQSDFSHSDGYTQSIQEWKLSSDTAPTSSGYFDSSTIRAGGGSAVPKITLKQLTKPSLIGEIHQAQQRTHQQTHDYTSSVKAASVSHVRAVDRIATPEMRARGEVQKLQAAYNVGGHVYTPEYKKVEAECKEKIKKSTNPEFKRILQRGIDDARVHFVRSDPESGATQLVESNPRGDISVSTHTVGGLPFQTISVKDKETTITYHFPLCDKPLYEKRLNKKW